MQYLRLFIPNPWKYFRSLRTRKIRKNKGKFSLTTYPSASPNQLPTHPNSNSIRLNSTQVNSTQSNSNPHSLTPSSEINPLHFASLHFVETKHKRKTSTVIMHMHIYPIMQIDITHMPIPNISYVPLVKKKFQQVWLAGRQAGWH